MKKTKWLRIAALFCALVLMASCIGPMNAISRLKTWNREIENRWAGEGLFILFSAPYGGVYGLFFLSDVLLFNSIEFWGGTNPIDPVSPDRLARIKEMDEKRMGSGNLDDE